MIEQPKQIKPKNQDKPRNRVPVKPYKKGDYKVFIKFYAMPSVFRNEEYGFKTETEFAKDKELSPETLTEWKKRKEFNNDVDIQLAKWGADKTPNVLAALYNTILADGKASEVKLWLQYIKSWKEGMVLEGTIETNENPLIELLDKLDEPTRNKVIQGLKANREARKRSDI